MRKKINAEIMAEVVAENKKGLKGKVVKLKAFAYDENSQDVSLLKGMPIIARMNCKNLGIANNNTYTIKSVADDIIVIKDDLERTMENGNRYNTILSAVQCTCSILHHDPLSSRFNI